MCISDHEILTGSADCYVRRYDLRAGQMYADFIGSWSDFIHMTEYIVLNRLTFTEGVIRTSSETTSVPDRCMLILSEIVIYSRKTMRLCIISVFCICS